MYGKTKKKRTAILSAMCMIAGILLPGSEVHAEYINTNRDTLLPEEAMEIKEADVDEYEKLY